MSETKNKHAHIEELAKTILEKGEFKVGEKKGDVVRIDVSHETFEKTLPEGLTLDQVKKVQTHIRNYAVAMLDVVGTKGIDVLKEQKDVERVVLPINAGHQNISAFLDRKKELRNPTTGEVTERNGYVSVKVSTSIPAGQVNHIRTQIAERFAKEGLGK